MKNLTIKQINEIADRYDLDPNDRLVIENAMQADKFHGEKARNFDGDLKRFWGCDASGHYVAANLLDGYLAEETRSMRCDSLAARDFDQNAYGY